MAKAQETTLVSSSSDFSDEEIVASGVRSRRRQKVKSRRRPKLEPRANVALGGALPLGLGFVGGSLGGVMSAGALLVGQQIAFSETTPIWIRTIAIVAVVVFAVAAFLGALRSVLRSIRHASHS